MNINLLRRIVGKAANYSPSVATDKSNVCVTTRDAAGAIVFTLPTPTQKYLGWQFEFANVRDQNMTVQGTTAGDICTLNNAAATSVAASTANQKIGARILATCVETVSGTFKWLVTGISVGHTYTVT